MQFYTIHSSLFVVYLYGVTEDDNI